MVNVQRVIFKGKERKERKEGMKERGKNEEEHEKNYSRKIFWNICQMKKISIK